MFTFDAKVVTGQGSVNKRFPVQRMYNLAHLCHFLAIFRCHPLGTRMDTGFV